MTEAEWLTSDDPDQLLSWGHTRFTPRQLRLFAVACCRVMQWRFVESRAWAAVEAVEAHVDEGLPREKLGQITSDVHAAWSTIVRYRSRPAQNTKGSEVTALAAWKLVHPLTLNEPLPGDLITSVAETIGIVRQGVKKSKAVQAALFREVCGNPFRPVALDPAWRTTDVTLLAGGIYAERAFDRMPILADALQDAGCDAESLLAHLRDTARLGEPPMGSPKPPPATHVRGCWALDLVLGKE